MKPLVLLHVLFLIFSGLACKKNKTGDNPLPPATQTGAGIFAMELNGQPWIGNRGSRNTRIWVSNDSINIGASRSDGLKGETFVIRLHGIYSPQLLSYELNDTLTAYITYLKYGGTKCFSDQSYGGTEALLTGGRVTFTRTDTVARIFAGTFSFRCPTDYCDSLIAVNGRFDLRF